MSSDNKIMSQLSQVTINSWKRSLDPRSTDLRPLGMVPGEDKVARRRVISEHAYVMREEQPKPSRSLQITPMTTEVQPVTSI